MMCLQGRVVLGGFWRGSARFEAPLHLQLRTHQVSLHVALIPDVQHSMTNSLTAHIEMVAILSCHSTGERSQKPLNAFGADPHV